MRIVLAALLSFLLLGMQHEVLVHAFQHDAARLASGKKSLEQTTSEGSCLTCVLNAGSPHGLAASDVMMGHHAPAILPVLFPNHSRDSLPPVYYASRAPPVPA